MPKYVKITSGTHTRMTSKGKEVFKKGDVMEESADRMKNILDQWQPLNVREHEKASAPGHEGPTTVLKVVPRGASKQWFDVINTATGKPINERALRKAAAEALVADGTEGDAPEGLDALDWDGLVSYIENNDLMIDPEEHEAEDNNAESAVAAEEALRLAIQTHENAASSSAE